MSARAIDTTESAAADGAARFVSGTMVVARGFTNAPPPLGLGAELSLGGGNSTSLERMRMDLALGIRPELEAVFGEALHRAASSDRPWLTVPPLLVCGPAGAGRTHVARRFAHRSGVPHVTMHLDDAAGAGLVGQPPNGPDLVLPALPVLAMAVGGFANPVVSVVGVEGMTDADQLRLATMMDPATGKRWVDHAARVTVDLSQVSWFVQCRDPYAFVPQLRRMLRPVELRWPDDLGLIVVEVLAEAAIDLGVMDRVGPVVSEVIEALRPATRRMSTADIYSQARQWLAANFADAPITTAPRAALSDHPGGVHRGGQIQTRTEDN